MRSDGADRALERPAVFLGHFAARGQRRADCAYLLASPAVMSRTNRFRQRISPPCVWSMIGPLAGKGLVLSQKFSIGAPSTTRRVLSHTQVRAPIWRMRIVFHSPKGLSATMSGSRPSVFGVLLKSPPEP